MEKLSEELKHCLETEHCEKCEYHEPETILICKRLLQKACERIKKYEEMFSCEIGDTVYVLAKCENIPTQLNGTLYRKNGGPGTATGYYCLYGDNCPFNDEDFDGCEKYKGKTAVFKDTVSSISIDEYGIWINTENCQVCGQVGDCVFLTQEEAEVALKERRK